MPRIIGVLVATLNIAFFKRRNILDEKITTKQAAKLLGVTTRTLWRWAKTEGFPKAEVIHRNEKGLQYKESFWSKKNLLDWENSPKKVAK